MPNDVQPAAAATSQAAGQPAAESAPAPSAGTPPAASVAEAGKPAGGTPEPTPAAAAPTSAEQAAAAASAGSGGKPAGDGKPAGQGGTPSGEAVVYDLKLPDGSLLDARAVERTVAVSKALGLSKDTAQKALEHTHSEVTAYVDGQKAQFEQVSRKDWPAQVQADKELGGANYDRTLQRVSRAMTRFCTTGFKDVLDKSGFGNHPELVRVFERIGAAIGDDGTVLPNAGSGGNSLKPMEEVFYGNSSQPAGKS